MAATVGTIRTRILLATAGAEPTEVGTVTTTLRGTSGGVSLSSRRWRRDLALAFFRMAWATWTTR
jgi:hypothetical protein